MMNNNVFVIGQGAYSRRGNLSKTERNGLNIRPAVPIPRSGCTRNPTLHKQGLAQKIQGSLGFRVPQCISLRPVSHLSSGHDMRVWEARGPEGPYGYGDRVELVQA